MVWHDAVLCIYAHAAWKNSGFIFGAEPAGLLEHFAAAVRLLTDMFMKNRPGAKTHAKRYLELILATFRLRALGDEGISRKLSLNSNMVRELYKCLEKMVEDIRGGRLEKELFFSRLKLEVTRSGEYADIPPLLFAVIGCITGETGENDIQISGIDSGDDGGED